MDNPGTDMARLSLLIQRILDTESLCDTEGAALLTEAEAAGRSLEEGEIEATRQHVEQLVLFTEALISTDLLALSNGRSWRRRVASSSGTPTDPRFRRIPGEYPRQRSLESRGEPTTSPNWFRRPHVHPTVGL